MIAVIFKFKLPSGIKRDEVISKFEHNLSRWTDNPDLLRKSFIVNIDKLIAGVIYVWKEKINSDIWLGAEFKKMVRDNFGAEPILECFETPIVVDNLAGNISKE